MVRKCSICGKNAIFGTMFKCINCQKEICHRHEKEQFIHNSAPGIEGSNMFYYYNYPNGKSVNYQNFKCYECRTGNPPNDMGSTKMFVEDYLRIFLVTSIIIFVIMGVFSAYGNLFGLSPELCKNLETTCIYYVVAVIAIFAIIIVIMMISYNKKLKPPGDEARP